VELLKKLVSSDGTHVVFSCNNLKLIIVLVSSTVDDVTVKERGFPIAAVIATSECEDIQKAIIAHIKEAVGPEWQPSLLMTDMALSAINAWKHFFQGLDGSSVNFMSGKHGSRSCDMQLVQIASQRMNVA
jgi:hypothetical protein